VPETEDEEEEHSDENALLPIFAPQAMAPLPGAFDDITSTAEVPIPIKKENPNFAIGFGLNQDDEEGTGHASFGQQPLDLAEFGGLPASSTGGGMDGLDEVDPNFDDGVTEGTFIPPSHSRQVSRARNAAINPTPPRQRHQPGLSNASIQSVMKIEELRPPNPPDANGTGIDEEDENACQTRAWDICGNRRRCRVMRRKICRLQLYVMISVMSGSYPAANVSTMNAVPVSRTGRIRLPSLCTRLLMEKSGQIRKMTKLV